MNNDNLYREFGPWLKGKVGMKVQKIAINAGFTCPNRDGTVGTGGCTYCNNQTFNPSYCITSKSITQQLEEGKAFFSRKYPEMKYLAYLQAYSNTYAPIEKLKQAYEEALSVEDVVGLVIGTRPDCVDEEKLDYLSELSRRLPLLIVACLTVKAAKTGGAEGMILFHGASSLLVFLLCSIAWNCFFYKISEKNSCFSVS